MSSLRFYNAILKALKLQFKCSLSVITMSQVSNKNGLKEHS